MQNFSNEVSRCINEHGRGFTRLEGRGGYTGDENAFVSICDAAEVLGRGFKSWRSL